VGQGEKERAGERERERERMPHMHGMEKTPRDKALCTPYKFKRTHAFHGSFSLPLVVGV